MFDLQFMVPQFFNLRPHLLKSIVHVIRLMTNRKYIFCLIYLVRLSTDNIRTIILISFVEWGDKIKIISNKF